MPGAVESIQRACTVASKVLPSFAIGAFVKAIANAWPTHYRYTGVHKVCPIGCSHPRGDDIRHLLICPVFCAALSSLVAANWPTWPMKPCLETALCLEPSMSRTQMAVTVLCHDVALFIVQSRRHHDRSAIEHLIQARVRALARHQPKVIQLVRSARGHKAASDHDSEL